MFRRHLLAAAIIGTGMAVTSVPAAAENATASVLEEIVVTATRRSESLQEVPVAVTAISGEALERNYPQDVTDFNGIAPNVQLQPVGAFQNASAFFIPRIGSTDIESAADPGIATFIDDVYQGRTSTALQDFLDVSTVEVLRGPQGTLFGRNAVGGVVHLRHNAPDLEQATFGGGIEIGSRSRADVETVANVPLSDTVALVWRQNPRTRTASTTTRARAAQT